MTDEEKLDLYRTALIALCIKAGGHLLIKGPPGPGAGVLMHRINEDNSLEFQWVWEEKPERLN